MPTIPIFKTEEEKLWFRDRYEAEEMNRQYDTKMAIRTRSMTRDAYYKLQHGLRKFFYGLKTNKFYGDFV